MGETRTIKSHSSKRLALVYSSKPSLGIDQQRLGTNNIELRRKPLNMSTALQATKNSSACNPDEKTIAMWKRLYCKDATDDEVTLFLNAVKRTGLSPEARQIWAIKRWSSAAGRKELSIQCSIDGFRLVAQRTGQYAGQETALFTDDGEKWVEAWVKKTPPKFAKVGVLRHDFIKPLYVVAKYDSFVAKTNEGNPAKFWRDMPEVMISKVAESQALRRAFPQELSGLYTSDEMKAEEDGPIILTSANNYVSKPSETKKTIQKFEEKPKQKEEAPIIIQQGPPMVDEVVQAKNDAIRNDSKTTAPYNPELTSHSSYLYKLLDSKKVDPEIWLKISLEMKGLTREKIDSVIDKISEEEKLYGGL